LPITKAVPKEMLPLGDRPVIHYILQELEDAGVTQVLILLGRGREVLLNYLDKNYEIDDVLAKGLGGDRKAPQTNFFNKLNIYYRRVPLPKGVADCVSYARDWVGEDNFVLAYCDDVFFEGNPTAELLAGASAIPRRYATPPFKRGQGIILAGEVDIKVAGKYGVICGGEIVEKPKKPKSNLVALGRYLLSPKFFEIESEDMITKLNTLGFSVVKTNAKRFDIGNKEGFYQAFQFVMKS
jgi:UTP--glucose-1-phosphate uridylyltransferase